MNNMFLYVSIIEQVLLNLQYTETHNEQTQLSHNSH